MQEIPPTLLPFALLTDPRREHPTTKHKLFDLLAIAVCAALCGARSAMDYEDMARTPDLLADPLLWLESGRPSERPFPAVFGAIDTKDPLHPNTFRRRSCATASPTTCVCILAASTPSWRSCGRRRPSVAGETSTPS